MYILCPLSLGSEIPRRQSVVDINNKLKGCEYVVIYNIVCSAENKGWKLISHLFKIVSMASSWKCNLLCLSKMDFALKWLGKLFIFTCVCVHARARTHSCTTIAKIHTAVH